MPWGFWDFTRRFQYPPVEPYTRFFWGPKREKRTFLKRKLVLRDFLHQMDALELPTEGREFGPIRKLRNKGYLGNLKMDNVDI